MEIIIVFSILTAITFWFYRVKKKEEEIEKEILEKLDCLKSNIGEIGVDDFFKLRAAARKDFTGIYVIKNIDKNMYYVGQSTKVLSRTAIHFLGRGNGDVYADYKFGDHFTISCYSLTRSGYESLDELEKVFIKKYDSCRNGYNRTQGNSNKVNSSHFEIERTPALY